MAKGHKVRPPPPNSYNLVFITTMNYSCIPQPLAYVLNSYDLWKRKRTNIAISFAHTFC